MDEMIYIWGWWQGHNLGDNWIKHILALKFPSAKFIDTSVKTFPPNSFVICGGGGLFIFDVIPPWDHIGSEVAFGVLGLGAEFEHKTNIAIELYKKSKFFYVRDQYSRDCMHLVDAPKSYDVTFSQPLSWSENDTDKNKVFFVWRDGSELLHDEKFADYICPGTSYDEWKRVVKREFSSVIEDDFQTEDYDIHKHMSSAGFVVSGRYHGVVAAIQRGLPFIAIDICPKIRALTKECGLEKYCIKISEIDKLESLIREAISEKDEIRKLEKEYRNTALQVLSKQIESANMEILKALEPLKIIHYGSYWMNDNDVINVMADDLQEECHLQKIDLKVYSSRPDSRVQASINTPNGKICILNHKRVLKDVKRHSADAIILNSGGLCLQDETFHELKKKNVITIGMSLSDPDVYPYNGKIYADKFDLFYTNSKYSFENEYMHNNVKIGLLPFAASVKHHYYMPEVSKAYDVVVVAHARPERIEIVKKIESICTVGTYGSNWPNSLGVVNGVEHAKAINSGNMYLSFAKTEAGFDNVKVGLFEAVACNQVVITKYMEELQDYFRIGEEILCYKSEEELLDLIRYYSEHTDEREQVREKGYKRFLREHTYSKRWESVLSDVYDLKSQNKKK